MIRNTMSHGLVLEDVRAGYGSVEVLHGINLAFPAGSVVALVGHNGSGCSTILRCAAGLVRPRSGRVMWDGKDITGSSGYRRSTAGMVLVADEHNVFNTLTVSENLELFGRPKPLEASVDAACSVFPELKALLEHRAGTMSGGERQMLALTRALVRPACVLLLDDVSRGLSAAVAERFFAELRSRVTPETSVVISEQFIDTALEISDIVYAIRRGSVVFAGEPGELTEDSLAGVLR
jgi:branched-chain amino acid transport system ATP-binding protein